MESVRGLQQPAGFRVTARHPRSTGAGGDHLPSERVPGSPRDDGQPHEGDGQANNGGCDSSPDGPRTSPPTSRAIYFWHRHASPEG